MNKPTQASTPNTPTPTLLTQNWFLRHEFLYSVIVVLFLIMLIGAVNWWRMEIWTTKELTIGLMPVHKRQADSWASWKTYTNDQYGFEFKYPPTWIVSKPANSGYIGIDSPESIKSKEVNPIENPSDVVIMIDENPKSLTLLQYFDGQNGPDLVSGLSKQPITIGDNLEAYSFSRVPGLGGNDQVIVIPSDDRFISFNNNGDSGKFNQILSTFKFTNPMDISNWTLWRTEDNEWLVKIPTSWTIKQFDAGGFSLVEVHSPNRIEAMIRIYIGSSGIDTPYDLNFYTNETDNKIASLIVKNMIRNSSPNHTENVRIIP